MSEDPKLKIQFIKQISSFFVKNSKLIDVKKFIKEYLIISDFNDIDKILISENISSLESNNVSEIELFSQLINTFYIYSKNYIRKHPENIKEIINDFKELLVSFSETKFNLKTPTNKKLKDIIQTNYEKYASENDLSDNLDLLSESSKNIKNLSVVNNKYTNVSNAFLNDLIINFIKLYHKSDLNKISHSNEMSLNSIKRKMSLIPSDSSFFGTDLKLEDVQIGKKIEDAIEKPDVNTDNNSVKLNPQENKPVKINKNNFKYAFKLEPVQIYNIKNIDSTAYNMKKLLKKKKK